MSGTQLAVGLGMGTSGGPSQVACRLTKPLQPALLREQDGGRAVRRGLLESGPVVVRQWTVVQSKICT